MREGREWTVSDTLMRGSELEKNGKQGAPHQVSLTRVKPAASSSPQLPVRSFKIQIQRGGEIGDFFFKFIKDKTE